MDVTLSDDSSGPNVYFSVKQSKEQ